MDKRLSCLFKKIYTNANLANDYLYRKVTISDEVFLTEVIYKWAKAHGRAEFYKMNYVSTVRLSGIFDKYIEHKYPINSNPNVYKFEEGSYNIYENQNEAKNVLEGTPPPSPVGAWPAPRPKKTIKYTKRIIQKNKLNENNQKLYNEAFYMGLRNRSGEFRRISDKLALENPEVMMNKNYFFNPFTNDLSKKPLSFPNYFFGGKRRTHKKRKTLKNRK